MRSGGAGIPLFGTPTGVGTIIETGGFIIKYGRNGESNLLSDPKPTYTDDSGRKYLLEKTLRGDVALIKAKYADKSGNLIYNKTARNFNQDMAKAADFVIAEVEEIVESGELDSERIHTPGIYVDGLVLCETEDRPIEKKTNKDNMNFTEEHLKNPKYRTRVKIARRAAKEIKHGMYLNLGIGMPTMVPMFIEDGFDVKM